ncbi:D-amino acid dehydrogenase [Hylemonella gracilis]|uniref:Putative D-amino acid dehydrogenase small subunit n=1 Tax=Hylemonella gracilis ATCC 19624 TaxID=887062 RepID=F3KXU3_9BURK|nr:D-amino acid dehydrogenase [Hylemonella gracilis]EGI75368.1 putative D-amino acid dehydrogenase small subunit [Hylemonella gracilis ATCC 19624]
MKVVVLGAGVVGMTTAYYLERDGHEVAVVERHARAANETSYGNAGGLCPSFAGPWAAPGMVSKVLRMMWQSHAPIRFRPRWSAHQWRWIVRWLGECNAQNFRRNKLRMQRVAHYSLACLRSLAEREGLHDFDFHADGTLWLFRTPQELAHGRLAALALDEFGVPWRWLEPHEINAHQPGLAARSAAITGAIFLPADASGDSHLFTQSLTRLLSARGVKLRFNTTVEGFDTEGDRIIAVRTSAGRLTADAFVLALGNQAPFLLRPLGLNLPVYPLKGYSITVPLASSTAPDVRPALMDEHNKVMISRLGSRIRAAGMAELGGYGLDADVAQRDLLLRVVREFIPTGLDERQIEFWAGLRPMTPDGPPILGPTRWRGLFLNAGHGSNGWTQACGTSRIVADLVSGRRPEVGLEGLTGERYKL